jgi:phytoene dehydrogenase-like protein
MGRGKLNLVLDEEPRLSGGDPDADKLRNAQFTLVPRLEGGATLLRSARQGRVHERLWIDCLIPSLLDSSLVTPGRHVMTCFVQYLPGKPVEGWETARESLQRQLLAHLAEHVPAVQRSLVASRLYTPEDLENTFGITEGNIFHGDLRPDQLFFMRPLPACALMPHRFAFQISGVKCTGVATGVWGPTRHTGSCSTCPANASWRKAVGS